MADGSHLENILNVITSRNIDRFAQNLVCVRILSRISIKFDRPMWPNEKTSWVVRYDDVTNPRWPTAAILDFDFGP